MISRTAPGYVMAEKPQLGGCPVLSSIVLWSLAVLESFDLYGRKQRPQLTDCFYFFFSSAVLLILISSSLNSIASAFTACVLWANPSKT